MVIQCDYKASILTDVEGNPSSSIMKDATPKSETLNS